MSKLKMSGNLHPFGIQNGNLISATEFNVLKQPNSKTVYEVIRIIKQNVLFFDDHLERFFNSCSLAGIEPPFDHQYIRGLIMQLMKVNHFPEGNIKFELVMEENGESAFNASYIPHEYPTAKDYARGVSLLVLHEKRDQPNAKIERAGFKARVASLLKKEHAYEALLVHPEGYITEGSRSNFYAILGNKIYTAPFDDVLPGITRRHVIATCHLSGIELEEKRFSEKDLGKFEACFISGTSPKILPVNSIGQQKFKVDHAVLRKIMEEFDLYIEKSMKNHSNRG